MNNKLIYPVSAGLIWLVAVSIIITSISATVLLYTPVPYMDEWISVINFYRRWTEGIESKLMLMFDQHSEHRIATARLIFLADCRWSNCDSKISLVWIYFNQFLLSLLFAYLYLKANISNHKHKWLVFGFILCIAFSWMQWENLTWGFQVQFVGVYFFSILSLTCLAISAEKQNSLTSSLFFSASLFIAVCSVYTMANGILIFPVLLVYAFLVKASNSRKIIIVVTLILCTWFYYHNYQGNSAHANPIDTLSQYPVQLLIYAFTYLGGILKHGFNAPDWLNQIAGFIYLCVFCYYIIKHFFFKPLNLFQLVLLGIAGFILSTAFATGLGRVNFGFGQAYSSRYAVSTLIGWTSLALICVNSYIAIAIISVTLAAIINFQIKYPYTEDNRIIVRQQGLISLMVDSRDNAALKKLYPDPNLVVLLAPYLEQNNYSIYTLDYQDYLGKKWQNLFTLSPKNSCKGSFDHLHMSPEITNGGSVSGWGWVPEAQSPATLIILTNESGGIVGLAVSGDTRHDVAESIGISPYKIGWRGYVKKVPGVIKAYAVFNNQLNVCELAGHAKFPTSYIEPSTEQYFPAQSYQLKADSAWAINAFFPSALNLPKTKTVLQQSDVWASWNKADANTGVLRVGPIESTLIEAITFTILTGPVSKNQKIKLISTASLKVLDIIDIPESSQQWKYYKIKVSPELDFTKNPEVYIDFHDNGSQFGEWFAIALPKRIHAKDND